MERLKNIFKLIELHKWQILESTAVDMMPVLGTFFSTTPRGV